MRTDQELMHRYAAERDEDAFGELVRRHIDFVHATALRQVGGDAHHASDVVQYVFTQLARDAAALRRHPVLAGWLYSTARNAAANIVRSDRRRQARETRAHAMHDLTQEPGASVDWNTLRPVIDDALCALDGRDREAVLLRFFEQLTFADIGARLALTGDAVRLRVERALDKMRAVLARRGVISTAAALAAALENRGEAPAPVRMATAVTAAALAGGAINAGWSLAGKLGISALGLGLAAALTVLVLRPDRLNISGTPLAQPGSAVTAAFSPSLDSAAMPPAPAGRAHDVALTRGPHISPFPDDGPRPIRRIEDIPFKHSSFTFVRVSFDEAPTGAGPSKIPPHSNAAVRRMTATRWAVDYPHADLNFSARFQQVTGMKTDPEGKIVALFDPEIRQYPFIYMVEGGRVQFSVREREGLRGYLLGGGFLMMDDFWGEHARQNVEAELKKVLPESEPVDLPRDHPIFRAFYELPEDLQVPNFATGINSQHTGTTSEAPDRGGTRLRGLFDPKGRLVAVLCLNTDLGDGWERIDEDAYYYREFSLKRAYPLGINLVVYALSQ